MDENLNKNKYTLDLSKQEISSEELINSFNILCDKGLISKGELYQAIAIANNKYKSMKQIMKESLYETT